MANSTTEAVKIFNTLRDGVKPRSIVGDAAGPLRAYQKTLECELQHCIDVRAMFSTGHDAANREAFEWEPVGAPDFGGLVFAEPEERCQ